MADTQNDIWPLPSFYFSVDFRHQKNIPFQQVSGLETEPQPVEYKHGNDPIFPAKKKPGISKVGNVALKRGVFVNDAAFHAWFSRIKMNTVSRETVIITLLDEAGKPKMTWTLSNAWPTKITGSDLKSDGNEVAIEAIELAYETLSVSAPQS